MPRILIIACTLVAVFAVLGAPSSLAQGCPGDPGFILDMPELIGIGDTLQICMRGPVGYNIFLGMSLTPGPTPTPFGDLCLGFPLAGLVGFPLPPSGQLCFEHFIECEPAIVGLTVYFQFVATDPAHPGAFGVSNGVGLTTFDTNCTTCTGRVGDFVFDDLNGNSVQDLGEPGIEGVVLLLKDDTDTLLDVTVTGADGLYGFFSLCTGCYTVEFDPETVPDGMVPVLCNQGGNDALDSDPSPAEACLVADDDVNETVDFGFGSCGPCLGGVSALSLRYLGATAALIDVLQGKKNPINVFSAVVQPGETFTFFGAAPDMVFGKQVQIFVDGVLAVKLHTSCSKPIGPGMTVGDFEVEAGASLAGGPLCDQSNSACAGGKLESIEMVYTGQDCSATSHNQDPLKVSCSGDPAFTAPVHIVAFNGTNVWFDGIVAAVGDSFVIDAANAGQTTLSSATFVDIFDLGNNLLQSVEFHTSCSQPLDLGDQFGALQLIGFSSAPPNPVAGDKPHLTSETQQPQ